MIENPAQVIIELFSTLTDTIAVLSFSVFLIGLGIHAIYKSLNS